MSETLTSSLVVLAISGLTYFAYKHPNAYKKMYWVLVIIVILSLAICSAYNAGIETTGNALNACTT